jgi:N-acyl-D-aspartate/D-glutamate deacylase
MTSGLAHPTGDDGKKMAWKKKIAMPMAAKPGEHFEYGGYELGVFAYALEHKLAPETFAQYLDALEEMPRTIDIATQVPHAAVRAYVMGERGANNEEATPEDIASDLKILLAEN